MSRRFLLSLMLLSIVSGCRTTRWGSDAQFISESPSRRYVALFDVKESPEKEESRSLVIRSSTDSHVVFSMPLERAVSVVWATDELTLAVVDDYGSSENRVVLISLPEGEELMRITPESIQELYPDLPSKDYSHVYFDKVTSAAAGRFGAEIYMYDPLTERAPSSLRARAELGQTRLNRKQ